MEEIKDKIIKLHKEGKSIKDIVDIIASEEGLCLGEEIGWNNITICGEDECGDCWEEKIKEIINEYKED